DLTKELVWKSVDVGVGNRRMLSQAVLNLFRRDILATADDQILDAARDAHQPALVDAGLVARVQPTVGRDRGARRLGIVVVAAHHVVAPHTELTATARRARGASGRIHNSHFYFGQD